MLFPLVAAVVPLLVLASPTQVLYAHLDQEHAPMIGVLSQANYDSVHNLLPTKTRPVVYKSAAELSAAVVSGAVHVGLVSGVPQADAPILSFSSTLVSPRAMFACAEPGCETMREALDASIVRAQHAGADAAAARANPPFEFLAVHTCRTNDPHATFPYPAAVVGDRLWNATRRGAVRIASLGPYDWANDGNYTALPPTGFWPAFEAAVEEHFRAQYGIGFERVWRPTSSSTMDAVKDGDADATAPYWTMDAYYEDRVRHYTFDPTCTTLGYDSTFFVKASMESQTEAAFPWFVAAGLVAACFALFVLYVRHRERRDSPLFAPLSAENRLSNQDKEAAL